MSDTKPPVDDPVEPTTSSGGDVPVAKEIETPSTPANYEPFNASDVNPAPEVVRALTAKAVVGSLENPEANALYPSQPTSLKYPNTGALYASPTSDLLPGGIKRPGAPADATGDPLRAVEAPKNPNRVEREEDPTTGRMVETEFKNGKKVSVREYNTSAEGSDKPILAKETLYKYKNDKLTQTTVNEFNENYGDKVSSTVSKFDKDGRVVNENVKTFHGGDTPATEEESNFTYDGDKQQLKDKVSRTFDMHGHKSTECTQKFEYINGKQCLVQDTDSHFNEKSKKHPLLNKETVDYKYDAQGRLISSHGEFRDAAGKLMSSTDRANTYEGDSTEPKTSSVVRRDKNGTQTSRQEIEFTYKDVNGKQVVATESVKKYGWGNNAEPYEFKDVQNQYNDKGEKIASQSQTYSDAEKKLLTRVHNADYVNNSYHNEHFVRDSSGNIKEKTTTDVKTGGEVKSLREMFDGEKKVGEQILTVDSKGELTLEQATVNAAGERTVVKTQKVSGDVFKGLAYGDRDKAVQQLQDTGRGDILDGFLAVSALGGKKGTDLNNTFDIALTRLHKYGNGSPGQALDDFKTFGGGDAAEGIKEFIRAGRGDSKKQLANGFGAAVDVVAQVGKGELKDAFNSALKVFNSNMFENLSRYGYGDADKADELVDKQSQGHPWTFMSDCCELSRGKGHGKDALDTMETVGDNDIDLGFESNKVLGATLGERFDAILSIGGGSADGYVEAAGIMGQVPGEPTSYQRGQQCIFRNGIAECSATELAEIDKAGKLTPEQMARINVEQMIDTWHQAGIKADGTSDPVLAARNITEKAGNGNGWTGQTIITELGRETNEKGETVYRVASGIERATHMGEFTDASGQVVRDSELGFSNWRERGALTTIAADGTTTVDYDGRRANAALDRLGRNSDGRNSLDVGVQTALDMTMTVDVKTGVATTDARNMQRVFDIAGDRAAIEQQIRDGLRPPGPIDFTARATTNMEMIASPDGKTPGMAKDAPAILVGTHEGPYGTYQIGPAGPTRSVETALTSIQNAGDGKPQYRTVENGIANTAAFVPAGEPRSFQTGAGYVAGMSNDRNSFDGGVRNTQSFSGTQQFSEGAATVRDVIGRNSGGEDPLRRGIEQVHTAAAATTGGDIQRLGQVTVAAGSGDGRVGAQALVDHGNGNYVTGTQTLLKETAPKDGKLNPADVAMVTTAGNGNLQAGITALAASQPGGTVRQALDQLQALPPAQREQALTVMRTASAEQGFKAPEPPPPAPKAVTPEAAVIAKAQADKEAAAAVALAATQALVRPLVAPPEPLTFVSFPRVGAFDPAVNTYRSLTAQETPFKQEKEVPPSPDSVVRIKAPAVDPLAAAAEDKRLDRLFEQMRWPLTSPLVNISENITAQQFARARQFGGFGASETVMRDTNSAVALAAKLNAAGNNGTSLPALTAERMEAEKGLFTRLARTVSETFGFNPSVTGATGLAADKSGKSPADLATLAMAAATRELGRFGINFSGQPMAALAAREAQEQAVKVTMAIAMARAVAGEARFVASAAAVQHLLVEMHRAGAAHAVDAEKKIALKAELAKGMEAQLILTPGRAGRLGIAGIGGAQSGQGSMEVRISRRYPTRGGIDSTSSTQQLVLYGKIPKSTKKLALIGPEIALAALLISAGVARVRGKRADAAAQAAGVVDQLPQDAPQEEPQTPAHTYEPRIRPTWLIRPGEDLCKLADHLFHDAKLGWLIADINVANLNEMYDGKKRVVELRVRQKIELPVWQDIVEFHKLKLEVEVSDLVTLVSDTAVEQELMQASLAPVIGVPATQPAMPGTAVPAAARAEVPATAALANAGVAIAGLHPTGLAVVTAAAPSGQQAARGRGTLIKLPALNAARIAADVTLTDRQDPTAVATSNEEVPAKKLSPKYA